MPWLHQLRLRFRALFHKEQLDAQMDDEMRSHIEMQTQENMEAGMKPEEARYAALRQFGWVESIKETCRDQRGLPALETLWQDLRYGARQLRKNPGFTAVAVLTLALGIGTNAAIFSLVDTVLLRMLPVDQPHDLVFIQVAGTDGKGGAPPYPCFERFREETSAFSGMAAFAADELRVEVDGKVEQVFGQVASGNYFEVLGLKPAAGRLLTREDERLNPPVAVISYSYWQRRFGGDPGVIGRSVSFRDQSYTIVGVTLAQFWGLQPGRQVDLTLPITLERDLVTDAGAWWFDAVARLRPGVPPQQASAQADTIFQSFMGDQDPSPELRKKYWNHVELSSASRGLDRLRSRFSKPLYALTLVSAIVLLMACANLGALLLVRGAARSREFSIRLATGATAGRILRQVMTESLLLFVIGAAASLPIAYWAVQGLTGFFAIGRNPILIEAPFDWRLGGFAAGIALAAGLLTGLWPAVRALRTDPQAAMKEGEGRLAGSRRFGAVGRLLIAGQVALSLVLMVPAAMFAKTMANLRAVDLGFTGHQVLTLSLNPDFPADAAGATREQFYQSVLERVRQVSGVRAASLSVLTPLSGRDAGRRVTVSGYQPPSDTDRVVHLNHVSEDYFQAFGIRLLAGRTFEPGDRQGALKVAMINESTAKACFAERTPIGGTIDFGEPGVYQVVGIVQDYKHLSVREPAPRFAFVPLWQPVYPISRITLAVSSALPAPTLIQTVAREIEALHANTLISDVIEVEQQIDATLLSERLLSKLAASFAVVALALAAIGLYGILSYSVARRRAEFGVRMALGATPGRVATGVFCEIMLQVVIGMGIGLLAARMLARAAEGLLFGVTSAEPRFYLFSVAVLAGAACLAAWLPAHRAAKVDPMVALRSE